MSHYTISPQAFAEIDEILDYVAADNRDAAERVRTALFEAFDRLARRPGLGHRRLDLTELPLRFRTIMGRYLVAYRGDAGRVEIVRVFGPGRDVAGLLR